MNGNGWKGWALAVLTAFLVGGGLIGLTGKANIDELEAKHDRDIEKVEDAGDRQRELIILINNRLIRIETKLDELRR